MLDPINAPSSVDSVAHVIQVALTPVFLLSGMASLIGVFAGRLARVADKVDQVSMRLETADAADRQRLQRRLAYLRRRSHALDMAVVLGTVGGAATCVAALLLFVGSLRDEAGPGLLFGAFGLALLCGAAALLAFLAEMLMASRGIRDHIIAAEETDLPDAEPGELPATDQAASGGP